MYEALLQSADRPFRATPDTKFYFPADSIEQARQTVVRAVLRAEGPCLVLGGAGLGKTMVGQVIADDVYGRFDIVKLHASGLCSRRALLQSILFELQLPFRALSEGELRMSIMDRLSPSPETAPSGILLLVDEAHTLSPKLLEELRLITNFARNGQPRARLVLIGNMRLEDTFANPQLDSFNQRLAARCYLQPLTRDQTMDFLRHQLRCVQIEPATIITNDALRTLYSASEGVPRLINQVMDHALVLAITAGQCPISAALIEEAWSDLQQLPAPWHTSNAPEKPQSAPHAEIEFGELSDEDEETFVESMDVEALPAKPTASRESAHANFTADTISITTARIEYPTLENAADEDEDLEGMNSEELNSEELDEYSLQNLDAHPIDVISKSPKQNFFAAFAPVAINVTDVIEEEDTSAELKIAEPTVANLRSPQNPPTAERVVFDASKAFGFNRHQASYPRGTQPVAQSAPLIEPFVGPVTGGPVTGGPVTSGPVSNSLTGAKAQSAAQSTGNAAVLDYAALNDSESNSVDSASPLAASFFNAHASDYDLIEFERSTDEILAQKAASDNVWENDPPIADSHRIPQTVRNPGSEARPDLFGEDFEEEIAISNKGGVGKDRRIFEPKPLEVAAAMPLAARHAAAEEQFAAMESQRLEVEATLSYEDAMQAKKYAANKSGAANHESIVASWTVDVSATEAEREFALHSEIEDLVSQLNFSAFAVEPYSVEQIEVEYQRDAAPSKRERDDRLKSTERETIYTLHTAADAESQDSIHSNLSLDDDRDLLIIEEELPVSNRMTTEQLGTPIVKSANYSQLFAKLRH